MQKSSSLTNQTPKRLRKVRAELIRLSLRYARMKTIERKMDTRQKIQLGGLVKKAGLDSESTAVLYGLFLEAVEKLNSDQAKKWRDQWKIKGDISLTNEI